MSKWHGYIGIENVGLSATQRATLIAELRTLGPASDPQPARLNHWRTRLDNEAAIFEALFNEGALTVARFKQRLATIFGVDPTTISDATQATQFGPLMTFSKGGTDYLRFLLFGGKGAAWMESGDGARAYLAANAGEWYEESDL